MHKHTKLTPSTRREIYGIWRHGHFSTRQLARTYHVDKQVIRRVLVRGRIGDFSVHDSANRRYRTVEYGLKRLLITERVVQKRLNKRNNHPRYERSIPGELLHGDTKRLPAIKGLPPQQRRREVLFVAIDDNSRFAAADILPDKTSEGAAVFLENTLLRLPFKVECHYSDNGGEYKGGSDHVFMAACKRFGLSQKFTQPYHPWTNGKAERLIKTIIYEWLRKNTFKSHEERRASLYKFIDEYNHSRPHMSLGGKTPVQRLASCLKEVGDNAC